MVVELELDGYNRCGIFLDILRRFRFVVCIQYRFLVGRMFSFTKGTFCWEVCKLSANRSGVFVFTFDAFRNVCAMCLGMTI